MLKGLSTNRWCDVAAPCLAAAGQQFVVRYYSRTTAMREKVVRRSEALQIAAAGLDLAVVYQDRGREEADFSAARGELDAQSALQHAAQLGQPPGSAIYFAVDADFSKTQIQRNVLPYFQAVNEVFNRDGDRYAIGVYGSGLTCRLLKAAPDLVSYTWLAEATGWRESTGYGDWDVKQHVNTAALCELGSAWEACDGKPDFGQFRVLGSTTDKRRKGLWVVRDPEVRLREMPRDDARPVFGALPHATPIKVLGEAGYGWVLASVTLDEGELTGYVAASDLEKPSGPLWNLAPLSVPVLPEAHLARNKRSARRDNAGAHPYPLGESKLPLRDPSAPPAERSQALTRLADWMDVENSARYLPDATKGATYCNVYAADYCFLAQVYLPRVWWTDKAVAAFLRGLTPPVVYDHTVDELRADDLHDWLRDYGPQFGWRRALDLTSMQGAVNDGAVGIICTDREGEGRSGHITVVVPEVPGHSARRTADGTVLQPLQSQAGSRNRRYGSSGDDWWLGARFKSFVMYLHD